MSLFIADEHLCVTDRRLAYLWGRIWAQRLFLKHVRRKYSI